MSSSTLAPGDAPAPPAAAGGGADGSGLREPAERGRLEIADRVVARVAGYAVTQVEGATAAPRRVLGVNVGDARPDAEASVAARVDGSTATVDATIAVAWPRSIRTVSDLLRQRVRQDVASITGVRVDHVDIEVVSMSVPASRTRRVH